MFWRIARHAERNAKWAGHVLIVGTEGRIVKMLRNLWGRVKSGKLWLIFVAIVAGLLAYIKLKPRQREHEGPTMTPKEAKVERERIEKLSDEEHDAIAARTLADKERIRKAMERGKE